MPSFRTEIKTPSAPFQIGYDDVMLSLGSCFSDHIGKELAQAKFNILTNPFGVLYNPTSIKQSLEKLLSSESYSENHILENQGLWQSFDFHSSFSDVDPKRCLANIEQSLKIARDQLKHLSTLIITFGTAHCFRHHESNQIVANCHKFPAKDFTRERLTITQIIEDYIPLIETLQSRFPKLKIIFTLSPIRHLKDGFEANQVSKSILRIAIDELVKATSNTHYFPSYEMILDDLRDYRFYKADLVHPNDLAIQYVWEHFKTSYFDSETHSILTQVLGLVKAANHKPFHVASEAHQRFKKDRLHNVLKLQTEYPRMNWDREIEVFGN